MRNPYRPGSGASPSVFVGRESHLRRARAQLMEVAASGRPAPQVTAYTGARGLGKTVLLRQIEAMATQMGFAVAHVGLDRMGDAVTAIAMQIGETVAPHQGIARGWSKVTDRLEEFSLEVSAAGIVKAKADWKRDQAVDEDARQHLRSLIVESATLLREANERGLVLGIDEIQDAPPHQLGSIAHALQDAISADAPVAIYVAGLSHTPEVIMSAATFAERFNYRPLERFDRDAAYLALIEPAVQQGARWESDAIELVLARAGGSPYLVQQYGYEVWAAADPTPADPAITLADAQTGIDEAEMSLKTGMYRGRWNMATPAEQELLIAIAQNLSEETGVAKSTDVSKTLKKTTKQLSTLRARLLDKGLIEAPGRGQLAFTMPGFVNFVLDKASA